MAEQELKYKNREEALADPMVQELLKMYPSPESQERIIQQALKTPKPKWKYPLGETPKMEELHRKIREAVKSNASDETIRKLRAEAYTEMHRAMEAGEIPPLDRMPSIQTVLPEMEK